MGRFAKPLRFRLPSGKILSVRQLPSSKNVAVVASDPIDSAVTGA